MPQEFVIGADNANSFIQEKIVVEEANISQPLEPSGPSEILEIHADRSNSAWLYIGDSTVTTTTGFPLKPGAKMGILIADSADVYAVSGTAGQIIHLCGGGHELDDPPISTTAATISSGGSTSTITEDSGVQYTLHTFTGIGILDVTSPGWVDILITGGGGGGGADGGGGGAGGGVVLIKRRLISAENYRITIGAGGAGAEYPFVQGTRGNNSWISQQADLAGGAEWPELGFPFRENAKFGGGGGGGETGDRPSSAPDELYDGFAGNGGGGGQPSGKGFQGVTADGDGSFLSGNRDIVYDGYKGGDHGDTSSARSGGGGAGSAQDGSDGPSGHGGKGIQLDFIGDWVSYGGGGGGAGESTSSGYGTGGAAGDGGKGGGGGGGSNRGTGTGGTGGGDATNAGADGGGAANTNTSSGGSNGGAGGQYSGGGGGAGSSGRGVGGNGGSGTVMVKYRIV